MVKNIRKKSSGVKVDEKLFEHELGSSDTMHQKNITCFNGKSQNQKSWKL